MKEDLRKQLDAIRASLGKIGQEAQQLRKTLEPPTDKEAVYKATLESILSNVERAVNTKVQEEDLLPWIIQRISQILSCD